MIYSYARTFSLRLNLPRLAATVTEWVIPAATCSSRQNPPLLTSGRERSNLRQISKHRTIFVIPTVLALLSGCGRTSTLKPGEHYSSHPPACLSRPGYETVPSGHRGDRDRGAGNTSAALVHAIQGGITLVEIDVRASSDGVLFLAHDKRLNTENYLGPEELRGEEIADLKAQTLREVSLRDGRFVGPIITLEEALALLPNHPFCYQLDIKGGRKSYERSMKILSVSPSAGSTIIQCPSLDVARELRATTPTTPILVRCYSEDDVEEALELAPEIVQIDADLLTPEITNKIHARGSLLLVKSLDGDDVPENWKKLASNQVDIILTDHPSRARHALAR